MTGDQTRIYADKTKTRGKPRQETSQDIMMIRPVATLN